jgi:hypothetical protein
MHDPRLIELIHLDLDGEASPAQRTELAQWIDRDAEARSLHDEMRSVHRALDHRDQVEPPEDLRAQIAEGVKRAVSAREETASRFSAAPDRRRRILRLGFALAAALVLVVLLAPALMKNVDPDQLRGTMAPRAGEDEGTSSVIPIAGVGIEGTIFTATDGRELLMRPELASPREGRLEVRFDPREVELVSIVGASRPSNMEAGRVVVELGGDPPELHFSRRGGGAVSLSLNISVDGGGETSMEVGFPASTNFSRRGL